MKVELKLRKTYTLDFTNKDLLEGLVGQLQADGVEGRAEAADIHYAIRTWLGDDMESLLDLDLDETDFTIEVPFDATVEVPSENEEE